MLNACSRIRAVFPYLITLFLNPVLSMTISGQKWPLIRLPLTRSRYVYVIKYSDHVVCGASATYVNANSSNERCGEASADSQFRLLTTMESSSQARVLACSLGA